jgi:hypothetical protein
MNHIKVIQAIANARRHQEESQTKANFGSKYETSKGNNKMDKRPYQ